MRGVVPSVRPATPPADVIRARSPAPRRPFLCAAWRSLVMLNFEAAADLLRPLVPRGTQLDEHQGHALLSVVGFRFEAARLYGFRVPLHQGFAEVNLRFYVRREVDGRSRRGVVFIKEIVPRRLVVGTARLVYGEHFMRAPVRCRLDLPGGPPVPLAGLAEYSWGRGAAASRLAITADRTRPPLEPAGEAAFVVNRSWAYSAGHGGSVREYEVRHRPWRIWPAHQAALVGDLQAWYGPRLAAALSAAPSSAFLVDGSEVAVFPGRRI